MSFAIADRGRTAHNSPVSPSVTALSVMSLRLLFVIALCLVARPAQGGAFAQRQGMLLVIQETSVSTALQAFDLRGRMIPARLYRKYTLDTLFEYGALDWLTFLGRFETVGVYTQGPPRALYRGLGMSELGARVELGRAWEGDLVFSAQGIVRLPGARTDNPAAAGLTQAETDGRLMVGGSFELMDAPGFWSAEAGLRKRGAPLPDEWRMELAAGLSIFDRLQVVGQGSSVLTPGKPLAPPSQSHKAQISLVLNPGRPWSLQMGTFRTIAGVNARQENGFLVAFWRRM